MTKRLGSFIAGLLIAAGISSSALAAVVTTTGGATIAVVNKSSTDPRTRSSTVRQLFVAALVTVPSGTRLITARFAGETWCTSPGAGHCILEIMARDTATGIETPLNPASADDFAFDSALPSTTDDFWESHAMERSIRLPAGNYQIKVNWFVSTSSATFELDDWHFRVETAN